MHISVLFCGQPRSSGIRVLVSILRMVFLYSLVRVRFCCGLGDLDIELLPFSAPINFNGGSQS